MPHTSTTTPSVLRPTVDASTHYAQRIAELDVEVATLKSRDLAFSRSRSVAFLIAIGLIIAGIVNYSLLLIVLGSVSMVGFIALIMFHEQYQRQLAMAITRRDINRQQVARIGRNWSELSEKAEHPVEGIHDIETDARPVTLDAGVANDLDLFGPGSVWQLVNQAHTPHGQRILHDWILTPAATDDVRLRQNAVQRLAPLSDFREQLVLHGRMLAATQSNPSDFIRWAEGPQWLANRPALKWATRALAGVMLALIIAILIGWIAIEWTILAIGVLLTNVIINAIWAGSIHDLFNRITAGKYDMVHYTALFEAVDSLPSDSPKLAALRDQMRSGDVSFDAALAKLQRVVRLANGRKSSLFAIPWTIVQIFFFWDFHVLHRLETWQARFGSSIAHWFDALGQLEALASLATLAHDQPDWCFPLVRSGAASISAESLGHPLLPPQSCVRNSVSVGPAATFLLVTGSNMSGKSTLLRSLGVNAVLALAGGPVCAAQFSLPLVELATSMRVTDSLNRGVSFFMAELQRLKKIVDRARQLDAADGPMMLYLLDEILQGTNTSERHVAVTRVIGHLLDCRAIGAVSTHDLELATAEELRTRCQLVHLRETIESGPNGDTMTFDYVVRPGVTPTTNALKLLEMVGLGDRALIKR